MNRYGYECTLFGTSISGEVDASDMGNAMRAARKQFKTFYDIRTDSPLLSWSDRKLKVKLTLEAI